MKEVIKIQAEGDFPFKFYIEKAQTAEEEGEMVITGVASTTNIDHDNERMSGGALASMATVINEKSVPLRVEHDKTDKAIVGKVFKAWVDERNQLWIKAVLEKAHPAASILHASLKGGAKLGLSVGGRVKKATREFSEAVGGMVKTFYDVALDEVSVTQRPANYDSWLLAKSIKTRDEDTSKYYESPFYKEFLFENQQLDYMQSFAKSIPDKSWTKVTINKNNSMSKVNKAEETTETETSTTKAEGTETTETETTKGYASKAEVNALKSMVTKGFETVMGHLSKMTNEAVDQENPKKDKPKTEETAKAEGTEALDQTNPDEKKPKTEETAKQREGQSDSEETDATNDGTREATKAEGETSAHPSEEETEKAETSTDTEDKYELKSMSKAIATIKNLTQKMCKETDETETATKAEGTTTTETETTKSTGVASVDEFVDALTKYVEAVDARFAKSGMRVPGSKQALVDIIKNSPEIQEDLRGMLKEPGFKKSVSMGVPYMTTKDGQRFALTATENNVEKSKKENAGKTFKDVYKSEFSSVAE